MPLPWPFRRHDPALLAQRHAQRAVATLVDEMKTDGPQRVRAALALLDRGFGRPRVAPEPETGQQKLDGLTDEQLSRSIDLLKAVIEGEKNGTLPRTGGRRRGRRGRRRRGVAAAPAGGEPGTQAAPEGAGAETHTQ